MPPRPFSTTRVCPLGSLMNCCRRDMTASLPVNFWKLGGRNKKVNWSILGERGCTAIGLARRLSCMVLSGLITSHSKRYRTTYGPVSVRIHWYRDCRSFISVSLNNTGFRKVFHKRTVFLSKIFRTFPQIALLHLVLKV